MTRDDVSFCTVFPEVEFVTSTYPVPHHHSAILLKPYCIVFFLAPPRASYTAHEYIIIIAQSTDVINP